jgi:hypothetical protein
MLRQGRRATIRAAWLALLGTLWLFSSAGDAAAGLRGGSGPRQRAGRQAGKPAYLWLWYATGGPMPVDSEYCGDITPPAYQCNFPNRGVSTLGECQRLVEGFLDEWYKDFNLVFSYTRPPSGDFYTIIVTSAWSQCKQSAPLQTGLMPADLAGLAPGNCYDNPGQTALAIECGSNAHDCATVIAHEHAHLVGLEHTVSDVDIMNPNVLPTVAGFQDKDNATVGDVCNLRTQNSYQQMLLALGPWPGGTKPAPVFDRSDAGIADAARDAGTPDGEPPDTSGDAAAVGTTIGPGQGPAIDGSLTVSAGFDAIARTPPVMPDAAPAKVSPSSSGGCNLARSPGSSSSLLIGGGLLVYLLLRRRVTLSRAAARARTACGS